MTDDEIEAALRAGQTVLFPEGSSAITFLLRRLDEARAEAAVLREQLRNAEVPMEMPMPYEPQKLVWCEPCDPLTWSPDDEPRHEDGVTVTGPRS
jgi:hypothetical protein